MVREDPMHVWHRNIKPGDLFGLAVNNGGVYPSIMYKILHRSMRQGYGPPTASTWTDVAWYTGIAEENKWICCFRHVPLHAPLASRDSMSSTVTVPFSPMTIGTPMASGMHVARRMIPYPEEMLNAFERERVEIIRKKLF